MVRLHEVEISESYQKMTSQQVQKVGNEGGEKIRLHSYHVCIYVIHVCKGSWPHGGVIPS